jgi:hypothetical protein
LQNKVFLSTDAGGVGLNLQAASAVINFEPHGTRRLEQCIGRVHRLGQSRPVQVIHLLTTGSIEERVWETLRLEKSLFEGVFDTPTAEVSFAALKRKSVLETVKKIFADQPGRPKAVIDPAPPEAVPALVPAPGALPHLWRAGAAIGQREEQCAKRRHECRRGKHECLRHKRCSFRRRLSAPTG